MLAITRHRVTTSLLCLCLVIAGLVQPVQAAGVLDRILERGKLLVATNDDYKPQSFQDSDGRWSGFDVEVAREIAARLKVSVEFVTPPWELVVSGRWRGRWDIAVNSMAATKSRAKRLEFAAAYYFTPVRVAVFKSDRRFGKLDDLNSVVIGVCDGCSYQAYMNGQLDLLKEFAATATYKMKQNQAQAYPDEWAAGEALGPQGSSEIDAVMAAEPTLMAMMNEGYPMKLLKGHVFNEPLAVAAEKREYALSARLERIIQEMDADGTIRRLSEKWFGADYSRPVEP